MQETLSIKVSPAEKALLKRLAEARGVKISAILREAIQLAAAGAQPDELPSCYQTAAEYFEEPGWIGASKEGDLSVNEERLRGFGEREESVMILADTGALVALLDKSDLHHGWALECFKALKPPLVTCDAVLAEAWHLLGSAPPSRKVLAAMHRDGILRSDFVFEDHASSIWKLLDEYRDVPMDLADACLVRLTEVHAKARVWTTDSDFDVYRRLGRQVIPVLASWQ